MRFYLLLALITGAAYATGAVAGSIASSLAWRFGRPRLSADIRTRGTTLALLRLLPAGFGLAFVTVCAGVFLRFEPRTTTETPGWTLLLCAAAAVLLLAMSMSRLGRTVAGVRACARLLRDCGRPWDRDGLRIWLVETTYPIAAVAGVFRPRVLISTRLLRECPEAEMAAIIRHEAAHLRRRDNLLRAAMVLLPDPLALTRTGREIHAAWAAAAERAADEEAAGVAGVARADLAAALLRVARMSEGTPPLWLPGMAFYEGANLEERVRRLLGPGAPARRAILPAAVLVIAALATAAIVAADDLALAVHGAMETAVRVLP